MLLESSRKIDAGFRENPAMEYQIKAISKNLMKNLQ